ncbi:MAG: hypothetical protein JJU02_11300 [Cryomorphaceae bacterium]|nr:hypothetical protein [Cryomorphaceae bacterium]
MFPIKIEGVFETEQVRIQKSTDKEDFGRKGLFGADSKLNFQLTTDHPQFTILFLIITQNKRQPILARPNYDHLCVIGLR